MITSLPMYDRPQTAGALDRFWSDISSRLVNLGIDAPRKLSREGDLWDHWESPDLLLSQTCGLPYRARLHGKVQIVGVLDYRLQGCPPGYYASKIVVRADDAKVAPSDWRGKRMAFNELRSQSGWAAMLNHATGLGTGFASATETGSHIEASRAVAEGRADIACIDAQTWHLISAFDPWASALKVIDQTLPTPGLPLITSKTTSPDTLASLRAAIQGAVDALPGADREVLNIHDVVDIPASDYLAVPTPQA